MNASTDRILDEVKYKITVATIITVSRTSAPVRDPSVPSSPKHPHVMSASRRRLTPMAIPKLDNRKREAKALLLVQKPVKRHTPKRISSHGTTTANPCTKTRGSTSYPRTVRANRAISPTFETPAHKIVYPKASRRSNNRA